jgi:hypothetical protein
LIPSQFQKDVQALCLYQEQALNTISCWGLGGTSKCDFLDIVHQKENFKSEAIYRQCRKQIEHVPAMCNFPTILFDLIFQFLCWNETQFCIDFSCQRIFIRTVQKRLQQQKGEPRVVCDLPTCFSLPHTNSIPFSMQKEWVPGCAFPSVAYRARETSVAMNALHQLGLEDEMRDVLDF